MKIQRILLVSIKLILSVGLVFPITAFAHLLSITATTPFSSTAHILSTATATFTVTNITSNVTLTAVDQSYFPLGSGLSIVSSTCGNPMNPGQSCNINVGLQAPPTPQTISAELREWAKPSADGVRFPFTIAVVGPQQFTVGGSVAGLTSGNLVLQNNGNDNLTISTNGAFTFSQPVSMGDTYNVTVLSQPPGQICTVSNGSGAIAMSDITNVSVFCSKQFAYVANYAPNLGTVSLCSIDPGTGALTCPGTTGSGFVGATAVAVNSAGTLAYVANFDGNSISLCSIDQNTGALACSGTTGSGFNGPSAITINPAGTFAYVSNFNNGSISRCSITPTTGDLTSCGPTGGLFSFPEYITINPQNTFAYVANGSYVSLCSITPTTGDLTSCAATGSFIPTLFGISINPAGTFLYVSDYFNSSVYLCSVTPGTGELTNCAITGGIFNGPGGITVNSAGTLAYVSNYTGNDVSLCNIEPTTGALTCPGTTGSGFSNPSALAY